MLGIFGLLILVLGAFAAGGGAFNWEFLFSDGYREHGWVRSLGREMARGICMLLGGVLVAAGFVSQMVDAAAKPVAVRHLADASVDSLADDAAQPPAASQPASMPASLSNHPTSAPPPAAGSLLPTAPPAEIRTGKAPSPPDLKTSAQVVTISSPDAAQEDERTLLILQYRFESGHQPVPDSHFFWVIELQGFAQRISYEGGSLEKQGQLTHLFDSSVEGGAFAKPWATWIEMQAGQESRQISNRLEIDGAEVRSVPLPTMP